MLAALPWLLAAIVPTVASSLIGNAGAKARQDQMNAYNTPAAQMARYSAAGLNPNLIYGQGTPGNQPSPVAFNAPDIDPVKIFNAHQAYIESRARTDVHRQRGMAMDMLRVYNAHKLEAEKPYWGVNAKYSSNLMKQQLVNAVLHGGSERRRQMLMDIDREIRGSINEREKYYNRLKDLGVERGDNPIMRMGTLLLKKYVPSFTLKH